MVHSKVKVLYKVGQMYPKDGIERDEKFVVGLYRGHQLFAFHYSFFFFCFQTDLFKAVS